MTDIKGENKVTHLIYMHKFGGKAVIKSIHMKLEQETTFVIGLLDGYKYSGKDTVELTEDEFHKEFKVHGVQLTFNDDEKSPKEEKPKNKREALLYLENHIRFNDPTVTRLYFNNGKDFVQDFSFYVYPFEQDKLGNVIRSSNYFSDDLCIALKNGKTLTEELEKELNNFIVEKRI